MPRGHDDFPAANALRFDSAGKLYVSDSFEGAIFEVVDPAASCQNGGMNAAVPLIHDGLLATAGLPPFGADGIAFGPSGHLWVAANQGDHVVALDANGLVVAQLGAFLGIRHDGAVRGPLLPSSVAIRGHKLFVTNLALPLTGDPDGEVEEMVTQYTISRINLPPLHD